MVHGKHTIEVAEGAATHEAVGRVGAKADDTLLTHGLDGGSDDALFFSSDDTTVACMGVECQHGNAWSIDAEVLLERSVENGELLLDKLLGEQRRNLCYGYMTSDECYAQSVIGKDHQCFITFAYALFDVFGMSGEGEAL